MILEPKVTIKYNGKNISTDVSNGLISCRYTDKTEGSSDELSIVLEDTEGLWQDEWYPEKGAKLDVTITYGSDTLNCGTFEIDEIELSGSPDIVTIRALGAGVSKAIRTKKSKAHENTTLKQLAENTAAQFGFQVVGTIEPIQIKRITQHREKDLSFLRRVALEYGYVFSVRGGKLVFTSSYGLEGSKQITEIDKTDVSSYTLREKTVHTVKQSEVKYHNPKTREVISAKTEKVENADGISFERISSADTAALRVRAENGQQAKAKAKAAYYQANSHQTEGSLSLIGNTKLVAGVSFGLTGFGKLSAKYYVIESTHSIDRSEGYKTEIAVKRVGSVAASKNKPKNKRATVKQAPTATTQTVTNADGVTFQRIQ